MALTRVEDYKTYTYCCTYGHLRKMSGKGFGNNCFFVDIVLTDSEFVAYMYKKGCSHKMFMFAFEYGTHDCCTLADFRKVVDERAVEYFKEYEDESESYNEWLLDSAEFRK